MKMYKVHPKSLLGNQKCVLSSAKHTKTEMTIKGVEREGPGKLRTRPFRVHKIFKLLIHNFMINTQLAHFKAHCVALNSHPPAAYRSLTDKNSLNLYDLRKVFVLRSSQELLEFFLSLASQAFHNSPAA